MQTKTKPHRPNLTWYLLCFICSEDEDGDMIIRTT